MIEEILESARQIILAGCSLFLYFFRAQINQDFPDCESPCDVDDKST